MIGVIIAVVGLGVAAVRAILRRMQSSGRKPWPIGELIAAMGSLALVAVVSLGWVVTVAEAADVIAGREPPKIRPTTTSFVPPTFVVPTFPDVSFPPPPTLRPPATRPSFPPLTLPEGFPPPLSEAPAP